jgi:acetyl-CoA synthetase (ADP-forming)
MEQLSIEQTMKLLEKYKLPFVKSKLCKSAELAQKNAKVIGFPVALKVVSPNIIHKSDIGGVRVNLQNEEEVKNAFEQIIKKTKSLAKRKLEGVLVQKMESGTEVIIGMKKDPQFGPVILFGLGGIFVEILKDTSLRIAPIDKKEAMEMIQEIKAYKILEGARGKKGVNIDEIANVIVKLSKLAEEKKIKEIDFNPVIVNEKTAKIVDARIMVE